MFVSWKGARVEDIRYQFILSVKKHESCFSEICQAFEISRKTGYKWLKRFDEEGKRGLVDKDRKPLIRPRDTPPELQAAIIQKRLSHPRWGAKKLRRLLQLDHPDIEWPSLTTFGNILKKAGHTAKAFKRNRLAATNPLEDSKAANHTFSCDFKGWWQTKDAKTCEPLTVCDAFSRYLLCCEPVKSRSFLHVWPLLKEVFQEHGMPLRFRTDNGPPFATTAVGRLSRLSVKLIRLGITPEWISPGKPQENGRHERMHRTLKLEAANPLVETLEEQKKSLSIFRNEYNHIRPHEALGMLTPAEVYSYSSRKWTGDEQDPSYSSGYSERRVDSKGTIYWRGDRFFLSSSR
jgi:transposase InsO family protein